MNPELWYACQDGVWYDSMSANGPWTVATSVPSVIYTIPVSSPLYYVTYVQVYGSSPGEVYEGYTPGYFGTEVADDDTVVYGTGYDYTPWIGSDWYGPPITWGCGFDDCWTPWLGWGFDCGFGWGCGYPGFGWWCCNPPFPCGAVLPDSTIMIIMGSGILTAMILPTPARIFITTDIPSILHADSLRKMTLPARPAGSLTMAGLTIPERVKLPPDNGRRCKESPAAPGTKVGTSAGRQIMDSMDLQCETTSEPPRALIRLASITD